MGGRRATQGPRAVLKAALAALPSMMALRGHEAYAATAVVDAESQLQLYSVRSPWGRPVLFRQRLIHHLGLVAGSEPSTAPESGMTWSLRARLRLDADYGILPEEVDSAERATFIPGLETAPVDLNYGYLEGAGLLRGTTSVAVGRQLLWDTLGLGALDGARLSFAPAGLFELSGYAGVEPRGGGPWLATHRFESDGVQRGSREGMTDEQWPSYLNASRLAPSFGASLSATAVSWLRARADYRRVDNRDRVVTLPFADARGRYQTFSERRVSSERLGVGLGVDLTPQAAVDGHYVYDWYRRTSERHGLTGSYRPSKLLGLTAGYRYRQPTFDADSIFNWFGARGTVEIDSGLWLTPRPGFDLGLSSGLRWLGVGPKRLVVEGLESGTDRGRSGMVRVDSSYRAERFIVTGSMMAEAGDEGTRLQTDLGYTRELFDERLAVSAQVGGGYWEQPLPRERAELSALYVAGLNLFPGGAQEMTAQWEHILVEGDVQRYRVTATAKVRWP